MDKRRRRRTPRGLAATTNATGCRAFSGDGAGEGMIVAPAKDKGGLCLPRPRRRAATSGSSRSPGSSRHRRHEDAAPSCAGHGARRFRRHRRPARRSGRNRRRRRTVRRRSIPAAPLADRHRLAPNRASKRAARRRAACVATRSSVVRAPARREGAGAPWCAMGYPSPAAGHPRRGAPRRSPPPRRRRAAIAGWFCAGALHGAPRQDAPCSALSSPRAAPRALHRERTHVRSVALKRRRRQTRTFVIRHARLRARHRGNALRARARRSQ